MGVASQRSSFSRAMLATAIVGFILIGAFWAALSGAANFGLVLQPLSSGKAQARWVAPDGPAWSAGLRPGNVVLLPRDLQGSGSRNSPQWSVLRRASADAPVDTLVPAVAPPISFFDAAIFALGMGMLALGLVVLARSADAVSGWAFWRMSLCIGVALAFVPSGSRGIMWVLALQFVALRLVGPAIAALAWELPARPRTLRHGAPTWLWLPSVPLLLVYPVCWLWSAPLFTILQPLDGAELIGYVVAASLLLFTHWWHGRTDHMERAQMRLITLGIAGGFAPFLMFTVLPLLVVGHELLPFEASILALGLLPLCVAAAIVRAEFLGITGLVHRRPLRLTIGGILLVSMGVGAWTVSAFSTRALGWPSSVSAAAVAVLSALLYGPLYHKVTRCIERIVLRDTYDSPRAFLELSVELTAAVSADALAAAVVERVGILFDLAFASAVSPIGTFPFYHSRSAVPATIEHAVLEHARGMLCGSGIGMLETLKLARIPVLFLPVLSAVQLPTDAEDAKVPSALPDMVLCLGPKRSGDIFTAQDRALLATLVRHITILLRTHALHAELDVRLHDLERLATERAALTERLITVSERERRELAAALHDDAIQLAGQVERLLGDLVTVVGARGAAGELASEAWNLSHEVTGHLRDIISSLHPPPLDMAGLVPALQTFLRDAVRRANVAHVACTLVYDPCLDMCRLSPQEERLLFQFAREVVSNALQHAAPRSVNVELGLGKSGGARLVVRDDGQGFVPQPLSRWLAAGHLGLALLHERVHEIGGQVRVEAALGTGTTVTIELLPSEAVLGEERTSDDSYRGR